MHPILGSRDKLQLYLAMWFVASLFLASLFVQAKDLAWWQACVVSTPVMLVYAFVCLATWYICRSLPLRGMNVSRLFLTFGFAGTLSSSIFVAIGRGWSLLLSQLPWFPTLKDAYAAQTTLLFIAGLAFFFFTVAIHYLFIAFEQSQEAERHALELRLLAQDAELKSLRAQIDPHFLFNSLNSISALTTQDPAAARRMTLLLADFFRSSLRLGAKNFIHFEDELSLIDRFVAIEQIRFGTRLKIALSVDPETKSYLVPPLLLQPLVENSIKHGIAQLIDGGTICVKAQRDGSRLLIAITNPFDTQQSGSQGNALGLHNVQERLLKIYDGQARLDIRRGDGEFSVELSLPARPD